MSKLFLLFLFLTPEVFASSKYHFKSSIGIDTINQNHLSFKNPIALDLGFGYGINSFISLGIDIQYRHIETDILPLKSSSYTSFVSLDLNLMDDYYPVVMYLTGGAGTSYHKVGDFTKKYVKNSRETQMSFTADNKQTFAWNVGVGVRARLAEDIWINFVLRHIDLGYFKTESLRFTGSTGSISIPFKEARSKIRALEALCRLVIQF